MSEAAIPIKKTMFIVAVTWILSLVTTLAIVYFAPNIFPIGTVHISDEAVTTDKIADSAIITAKLADGSVTSARILDGTLTAVDLADGCIIATKVCDGAVTTTKIADGSVSTAKILDETITPTDLATGSVTTIKIAEGNVTTSKISDDAIVTIKLADGSVTSAKILDGAVTAVDLANNSVITAKIADGAVTTSKIADGAVTDVKLASQAIPFVSTYSTDIASTTETAQHVDMSGMSVVLSLNRSSHILIMVSLEALADYDERIYIRALINGEVAKPGEVWLTPVIYNLDTYLVGWASYTYNFYQPSVGSGTYTIQIQWKVSGGSGDVALRTLTVIALPA